MNRVWVPPRVRRELAEQTAQHVADIREQALRDATLDYWDKELKKLDPALSLVKAKDNAEVPGLKPGYWHVVRDCSPGPPALLPVTGPDGEYVEPTSELVDLLRAGDLQNPRAMRARIERDERRERERERQREAEHQERVDEMMDRWKAATQTSVSMNPDVPWTQNASANARRDRDQRKPKKAA